MSYIMLTTRCNMDCDHCCGSYTAKGEDMSFETFKRIIDDYECGGHATIGGGEPTLHPRFWDMVMYAVGQCDSVWLATNGSMKETSLTLAKLAEKKILGCDLSLDQAHDWSMVDDEVRDAFTKLGTLRDVFNVGSEYQGPMAMGRALENYEPENMRSIEDGCACTGPIFAPNGDILWCGCPGAPVLGNVHKGEYEEPENYHETDECHTAYQKFVREEAEAEKEESNAAG